MEVSFSGLRKKRAAPPPPVTRPLSSAISSQGLERIVDSEESLTSDIDPSKPPSDISASSKANSDIEERPKASSDIGVTTIPTKLSSTVDFTKSDCPKADAELKSSKSDIETRHRSGFVNVKLSNTMAGNPTPIEDAPVDARVSRKRGKLTRSYGSIENDLPSYSFVSRNSFENAENGMDVVKKHRSLFDTEKIKLHSRIEECKAERRLSDLSDDLIDTFVKSTSVMSKTRSLDTEKNSTKANSKLQKSQSFACSNVVAPKITEWSKTASFQESKQFPRQKSFKSQSRLVKMQTVAHLDDIETDIENVPECGVPENRFSPIKLQLDNYICDERCQAKPLKYSSSFQVGYKLRETKIVSNFEKPRLSSSQSFSVRNSFSDDSSELINDGQAKLGNVSTTSCYDGLISSSLNEETFGRATAIRRSNLSPPPLSSLHIFAISKKPLDIPVTNIEPPVPSNVDKLPSLPIIQHTECKLESEKKLSILEPPPPGLVSRKESTESWNRFLIQLNSILESRAGEFV